MAVAGTLASGFSDGGPLDRIAGGSTTLQLLRHLGHEVRSCGWRPLKPRFFRLPLFALRLHTRLHMRLHLRPPLRLHSGDSLGFFLRGQFLGVTDLARIFSLLVFAWSLATTT